MSSPIAARPTRARLVVFLAAIVGLLVQPLAAAADVGLIVRQSNVRPGQSMTVWGGCTYPVYLVPEPFLARTRQYHALTTSTAVPGPPKRLPFRFLGRPICTNRTHFVGEYPGGDWSSWTAYLRVRLPSLRPGRYQLAVYCASCLRGPGGSLIVRNYLWRGSERVGLTALTVQAADAGPATGR